ncbi:pleckstrin homology domain-containing family G member 5 [Morone saxatilis]|uniref:pleckstrin homology domain-containing family G member 5 n=1 Tax=Morone saxatilis TaxID=34816 RepID=UPI0015E21BD7|nr:pleckstrin homology domain-containing family G member 5 [Morone saxatilis]
MFLYWKKRGAYELEALPSSLTQLGIERYSWSSSLDVIHDLCDDKPVQEEDWVVCQHPECPERRRASKVCHHPDCLDLNNKSPLHLCESCDSRCHSENTDNMHFDRHPRFDLQPQASILARNVSTRSCPPRTSPPSDLEEEDEGSSDRGERKTGGMKLVKKKPRRRHTDDPSKECFSLKFDLNVDINTEIVPAMKKKTLREVLAPVFERNGIELSRVDLFLDQSNTPLSLNFEAYRFGGHYLKVKARLGDELKVEQSVKDLRSLSLPNMKASACQSPYILAPASEKVEHGSLGRKESVDLLVSCIGPNGTVVSSHGGYISCDTPAHNNNTKLSLRLIKPKYTTPLNQTDTPSDSYCFATPFTIFHNFTFSPSSPMMSQLRRRKNMTGPRETIFLTPDALDQNRRIPAQRWSRPTAEETGRQPLTGFFSSNAGSNLARILHQACDLLHPSTLQLMNHWSGPSEQLPEANSHHTMFRAAQSAAAAPFHQDFPGEERRRRTNLNPGGQLADACWTNSDTLTRRQFHQQEAIWELLQTEATYIKKLRVITDLFLSGLLNLQESGLLTEAEPPKLFSNIQEIVRLHTSLWNQVMLPVLEKARQARALLDPTDLHHGFRTFGSRFQPYIRYCMEEEGCMEYMRTLLRDNELFRTYVTWGETHKQCNRLKLADMVAKPHQRLTKYPLLLKSILKKTDEPSAREIVNSMVATVERFINSVDSQMRQRQEKQKLATISARIDSYEAVEGSSEEVEKILKEYNRFDLMAPMRGISPEETRQLHLEGALRMKEGKDSRMEVYCVLFTDLLLITKPGKRVEKVKIIRQPLLIHNVVCKELKDPGSFILIYLNEFKSAVAAYTFQANSATQGRSWIDAICNVQNQLQRLRNEEVLRQQSSLKRCTEGELEEEEEDESSNSTTSSPCLRHKDQQNSSQSDGSTETLSVMDIDEPGEHQDPPSPNMNLDGTAEKDADVAPLCERSEVPQSQCTSPRRVPSTIYSEHEQEIGPDEEELDPQCRSLSMDSAYGTLSPESLLRELQPQPGQSEGEETEEEEGDREGEEAEQEEAGIEEVEEEEEEDAASLGSQLSVVQSSKPRRRPHIQPRFHCLQRLSTLALSRSEDNLLQRFHGKAPVSHKHSLRSEVQDQSQCRDMNTSPLAHSRSLSELGQNCLELFSSDLDQSEDCLSMSMPSDKLCATLRRAEVRHGYRAPDGPCEGNESQSNSSDGETAPSACVDKKNESTATGDSGEVTSKKRKSPVQQHKKLTLAQLYRIRTTLVLNSTLTASEV